MARSSPFTRLFAHLVEDLSEAVELDDMDLVIDAMPSVRRLITMVLTDDRFADELPKELRDRLQFVLASN